MDAQSRKLNRLIRTFTIKDLRGLGLKHAHQPTLALLHRAIKIGTENYPEMLEKLLIINAPSIFNMIWAIVRPMINQNTIEKIGIFGVSGYQDIIKQHFDLKLVPIIVGGSCISCVGGCIKNCPGSGANADGSQTLEIAAGTKYEMSVELAALNELKWSFVSKDYDVPFTVTFQPGKIILFISSRLFTCAPASRGRRNHQGLERVDRRRQGGSGFVQADADRRAQAAMGQHQQLFPLQDDRLQDRGCQPEPHRPRRIVAPRYLCFVVRIHLTFFFFFFFADRGSFAELCGRPTLTVPPVQPERMFEALVSDVINRVLGAYVQNVNKEQLSVGIWSGKRTFSNGLGLADCF